MRIDILSFLLLLSPIVRAAVLAIDYGAEFTKLSLIKPGIPFDVVLDRDSKRKVQSVVGWKRDDRVFGAEAKMAATRFPDTHFPYIKPLIGRSVLHGQPTSERRDVYLSPPTLVNDTLYFPHPNFPDYLDPAPQYPGAVWTSTALLAHEVSYYRGLAEELASTEASAEKITQFVVTVPAWWNSYQRRAYRDALELQGLTCLAMISEGTAVGLNYAMTRSFPDFDPSTGLGAKEYHIIYDSGAMGTTASVLAFYQTSVLPSPKSKTPINTTHIELLGIGWEELGGVDIDLAVREILLRDFEAKSGQKGVKDDKRALAKLGREAVRVKQILSANQESNVAIESLYNDIDYRSKLSRTELEASIAAQSALFSAPITNALQSAGLTLDDISSFILFGGNTRVPLVQSAIREVLGSKEDLIAQNVNADEAAVLGAAYYGAFLSRGFRTKSLEVVERTLEDYKMGDEVIFPKGSRLGERKAITLEANPDQVLEFSEGDRPVLSLQFLEVAAALANFTSPSPVINMTVRLDPRGHLSIANAVLISNVTESSTGGVAGALKGFFGKKDEAKQEVFDAEGETDGTSEEGKDKDKKESKVEKTVIRFREKHVGVKPLTGEEKRTTMSRLTSTAQHESAKTSREEARNLLEGYLYRLQAMLDPEGDNPALREYSTASEQKKISKLLKETFEWLSDHAEKADEKTLRDKRAALQTLEDPIILRFKESQTRFKAVEAFQQAMFMSRAFLVEATKNRTEALEAAEAAPPEKPVAPPKFTETELKEVETMMKELEQWMDPLMEEQMKIEADKTADPVILSQELDEKGKKLQMTVLRLQNKKNPKAPKPPKPSSSSTTATAATTASDVAEEPTATPAAEVDADADPIFPTPDEEPTTASEDGGIPKHEEL